MVDGCAGVCSDLEGLFGGSDSPPDVDRSVEVEVSAEEGEGSEGGSDIGDGGLLDSAGVSTEDGHLLDHDGVTGDGPAGKHVESDEVHLELVELGALVGVGDPVAGVGAVGDETSADG